VPAEYNEWGLQRRVVGVHDIRLDGILDLTIRAKGASVMDLGCNRGLASLEMANNGATACYGCDNFEAGIDTARHIFADIRAVKSRFEVVDLTQGPDSLRPFGGEWDIVLMLATYHKLKREMDRGAMSGFMQHVGKRTKRFFGWRGPNNRQESDDEIKALDHDFKAVGLERVHTSYISREIGPAAIWARNT
jgi:SAM-dependent methyltransferase